MPYNII